MYAAIATDLDGTLLDAGETITTFTAETLRAAATRGIELIIATGRHVRDVRRLTADLGVPISLITTNGARVHDSDGTLLFAENLAADHVRTLIQPELARGSLMSLYLDDRRLSCVHEGYELREGEPELGERQADLSQHSGEGVAKVLYTGRPARLAEIEANIRQRLGEQVAVTYSQPDYLEVMAAGINKGQALSSLLARRGIDLAQCAAFGDGLNDAEMLQVVGHPFRMTNANPRLTALLPRVPEAGHHDEAGVAHQIRKALALI
ncbi:Cof-type HAD-IIB family hydrolase [Crenobacter sp. SG2303]|uniref:Cof-type HAD-IIB family hydrolase n=1 Tax=Crenobacter oryzisoli TaxID=3056844 RepID=A0ABT7XN84_9NEIS|nr:Cof-type HAD-IIB family hydrolase [Crenobacter sp. SG2303]MDN0075200.1 Cof-type HAD-IIB family hydrolase [Crenobacter sp. SG2303]